VVLANGEVSRIVGMVCGRACGTGGPSHADRQTIIGSASAPQVVKFDIGQGLQGLAGERSMVDGREFVCSPRHATPEQRGGRRLARP
jgi:hypothetical protein